MMKRNNKNNRFLLSINKNFYPWLIGVIFSLIFFSLIPWLFAYYGYIDLRLPSRFDFQKINTEIRNNIPKEYNYSTMELNSFRSSGPESIIVFANRSDYFNTRKLDKDELRSGIFMILDRTENGYKVSYKYRPVSDDPIQNEFGLYLSKPIMIDLDNDNKKEIVTEWNAIGADVSPGFFIIFDDKESNVAILTNDNIKNVNEMKSYYKDSNIYNYYNSLAKNKTKLNEFIIFNGNQVAVNYVMDQNCRACDHKYRSDIYSIYNQRLIQIKTIYFNNNDELEKYKKENKMINPFTESIE